MLVAALATTLVDYKPALASREMALDTERVE